MRLSVLLGLFVDKICTTVMLLGCIYEMMMINLVSTCLTFADLDFLRSDARCADALVCQPVLGRAVSWVHGWP